MIEFKVGDKVKVVKDIKFANGDGHPYKNRIGYITKTREGVVQGGTNYWVVFENVGIYLYASEIELIEEPVLLEL